MPYHLAPSMFAKVMSLPEHARSDLLELLGASTVDEAKLDEIIEEIETSIVERKQAERH